MTWRIVEVSSNSKLDLKLNYMVVRSEDGIKKVFIPEIAVLIIESTAISMTAALLCELTRQEVKIIFCDEKRNPYGELAPYYGTSDCVEKRRLQVAWTKETMALIWSEIVRHKILNQSFVLERNGHYQESAMLKGYTEEILPGDTSNREGHAAKVYFNALFGMGFSRRDDDAANSALNYGYAVLLSAVNRSIVALGYSTIRGIFHDNGSNQFNLGSDLMEPFRPIVDEQILSMRFTTFESEQKRGVLEFLNKTVIIDGKQNYILNAVRTYVQSFFTAMEKNDPSLIKFHEGGLNEAKIHEDHGVLRSARRN